MRRRLSLALFLSAAAVLATVHAEDTAAAHCAADSPSDCGQAPRDGHYHHSSSEAAEADDREGFEREVLGPKAPNAKQRRAIRRERARERK